MSTKEKEVPTMYIEILSKGESGYVREDTVGTAFEDKINCPGLAFVPNTGFMAEEIVDEAGKPTGRFRNVAIRYIKNCPYIKVADQVKFGYEKNKIASNDAIPINKGKCITKDEGDRALFEYFKKVFYNDKAPNRPRTAKAIFTVLDLEANLAEVNEEKFLQADAISCVKSLVLKTGSSFKFKEAEIDNILTALNVFGGDNYSEKINVLTREAEMKPKHFLDVVAKLKSIVSTEIVHAIELNVIRFEGNTCQYVDGNKVVGTVPTEFKNQDKKIEALSTLLKTPEYAQAYQDLKVQLEIAQEKQLKS